MAQGDPRYGGDAYRAHLTDERSQNGAHALEGYPLDVQSDSNWPGLDGSAQARYDAGAIKDVADLLRAEAERAKSLPGWLQKQTTVNFGPDVWRPAKNLRDASAMVSQAVADYMQKTIANMTAAAGALDSVHSTYTGTEQANVDKARATNSALGDPGSGAGGAGSGSSGSGPAVV
jgi:hypothetical protein